MFGLFSWLLPNPEKKLQRAAGNGDVKTVSSLLASGVSPNNEVKNPTPLMAAVLGGSVEVTGLLLDAGAQIDEKGKRGFTALMLAITKKGREDVVKFLLSKGANLNAKTDDGLNALLAAASVGNTGAVDALLEAGADLNCKDSMGGQPLMLAAAGGHLRTVKTLLEAGADPNHQSTRPANFNALFFAVQEGHADVVDVLLEAGADPNKKCTNLDVTPLWASRQGDNKKIERALSQAGAEE